MRKERKNRFSLIELLIVIAVIAILVGLLLPSLKRARDKARSIACMNNQKQNFLAWTMYADSYDGFAVKCYGNDFIFPEEPDWSSGRYWGDVLLYLGFVQSGRQLLCPALPISTYASQLIVKARPGKYTWENYSMQFSSGMNVKFGSDLTSASFRLAQIKHPSRKILFGDSRNGASTGQSMIARIIPDSGYRENFAVCFSWHPRTANIIFSDGHGSAEQARSANESIAIAGFFNKYPLTYASGCAWNPLK